MTILLIEKTLNNMPFFHHSILEIHYGGEVVPTPLSILVLKEKVDQNNFLVQTDRYTDTVLVTFTKG